MNYSVVKEILLRNQAARGNTYLVPIISFDGFIKDELTFVRKADGKSCTIFRPYDGKIYSLTKDQIKKFKCVGAC